MAKVVVYLGPVRSGKTFELVRQYRDTLRQLPGAHQRACWLSPNARTANAVRRLLLADGLGACLAPGIVTFDQLTNLILADASRRHRPISRPMQRELLRRAVRSAQDACVLDRLSGAAGRAGFIDLLAEHVEELERRGLSPRDYLKAQPVLGDTQQHRELAHLYAEYVRLLEEHNLLDPESTHLAACNALTAGTSGRFQYLQLIVADGFTDFTATQHTILRLLAQRAQQLLISLPDDAPDRTKPRNGLAQDQVRGEQRALPSDPLRPDLFAKVRVTLAELERHHSKLELRRFAPRPSAWPTLDYISQQVFRRPGQIEPPSPEAIDTLDQVEIVEAAGSQDEVVEIARRVKRCLASGNARPGDIVVVFRSLSGAASRVREVFELFGIPYYLESNPLIVTAPVIKTLLSLLRLDSEDWPFRRVISLITNNLLTTFDETSRQSADWLARDLQIARGRDALLERVDQLAADSESASQSEYAARRSQKARLGQPCFTKLAGVLDGLPHQASFAEWCQALAHCGAVLGLSPFAEASSSSSACTAADVAHSRNIVAWQAVTNHFAALERLESWLGQPPRTLSRGELLSTLVDIAGHESLPAADDHIGRVSVLTAPAARNISARHLFLAGMSEQAFPLPERTRLCSESEYRFAARVADQELAALQVNGASRAQEEMLLFYEVISRAEQSLTISYPALDDKAQEMPPSPYVLEIERTIGSEGMKRVRRSAPHLSPVPANASPCSLADWRLLAVAQAIEGKPRLLANFFANAAATPLPHAIDSGIRIVNARARGDSFGAAEGLLTSPAVAARLAKRFGPQHLWSPSQWETYAACPFKFFLDVVLGLEPLGDLVLETDFARRGSRLHHVMAIFYRHWAEKEQWFVSEEHKPAFRDQLIKVIEERIVPSARGGIDAALLELDRRQLGKWAEGHFDHHCSYQDAFLKLGGPLEPRHFEFRFGPSRSGDTDHDPSSTSKAFTFNVDGESVHVTGQIDRIDVATINGEKWFNVIDYKTGRKSSLKSEQVESGERLQLPIYVEAAQTLLFGNDAKPLAAGYWSMEDGFDTKGALAVVQEVEGDNEGDKQWEATKNTVRRLIRRFIDSIRRGDFPVASRDDKCTSYCEFRTVCRVNQIRSLGKSWPSQSETDSDNRAPGQDT